MQVCVMVVECLYSAINKFKSPKAIKVDLFQLLLVVLLVVILHLMKTWVMPEHPLMAQLQGNVLE